MVHFVILFLIKTILVVNEWGFLEKHCHTLFVSIQTIEILVKPFLHLSLEILNTLCYVKLDLLGRFFFNFEW